MECLWMNCQRAIFYSMLGVKKKYLDANLAVSWISFFFLGLHLCKRETR